MPFLVGPWVIVGASFTSLTVTVTVTGLLVESETFDGSVAVTLRLRVRGILEVQGHLGLQLPVVGDTEVGIRADCVVQLVH